MRMAAVAEKAPHPASAATWTTEQALFTVIDDYLDINKIE
jgi:hypothetical protein